MKPRSTAPSASTQTSHPVSPTTASTPYSRVNRTPSAASGIAASTIPPQIASHSGSAKKPHQPLRLAAPQFAQEIARQRPGPPPVRPGRPVTPHLVQRRFDLGLEPGLGHLEQHAGDREPRLRLPPPDGGQHHNARLGAPPG